jgi:hypothetical protein
MEVNKLKENRVKNLIKKKIKRENKLFLKKKIMS